MEPIFFTTPEQWRAWLEANHDTVSEVLVGFHKKASGRPSISWPQSVDEALCFGWIDGVRTGRDADSYTIRFTPRKPGSTWSAVNIDKVRELTEAGRMRPAGQAAFEARAPDKSKVYAYENYDDAVLDTDAEAEFRANAVAWAGFQAMAPSYRRTAIHRVVSAKRADTRARRLAELIACSERGEKIPVLTHRPGKK